MGDRFSPKADPPRFADNFVRAFFFVTALSFLSVLSFFSSPTTATTDTPATNSLWVAAGTHLNRLDPNTYWISQTFDLTSTPQALVVDSQDDSLWVLTAPTLSKFDANASLLVELDLRTLEPGIEDIKLLQMNPYDASLWLAGGKSLLHLNRDGKLIAARQSPNNIHAIALDLDESLWVLTDNELLHFAASATLISTFPLHSLLSEPRYLALDQIGRRLAVADTRQVVQFDLADLAKPPRLLDMAPGIFGIAPDASAKVTITALGADPLFGTVWVLSPDNLLIYDRAANFLKRIELHAPDLAPASQLAFDPVSGSLWVAGPRSLGRFRNNGEYLDRVPLADPAKAIGLAPFKLLPRLSLLAPPEASETNRALPDIHFGLSGDCSGVYCIPDSDYTSSLNLDIRLNNQLLGPPVSRSPLDATFLPAKPIPEGPNSLSARATDRYHHSSVLLQNEFTLNTHAPQFVVLTPSDGTSVTTPNVLIEGQVDNLSATVNLVGVGTNQLQAGSTFHFPVTLQPGVNSFTLTVTDRAGNVDRSALTLIYKNNPAEKPAMASRVSSTTAPGISVSAVFPTTGHPPTTSVSTPIRASALASNTGGTPSGANTISPGQVTTAGAGATVAAVPNATAPTQAFGRLPLSFELNQGQTDASVKFLTRSTGHTEFFTPRETVLVLRNLKSRPPHPLDRPLADLGKTAPSVLAGVSESTSTTSEPEPESAVLRMKFIGAQPTPRVEGLEPLITKSNYLIGNDPKKWIINVPHYAKVKYHDVYPGIDQVFYGKEGALEYDLVVKPGADPAQIKLAFEGAESQRLDDQGDLVLQTALGPITQRKPILYQDIDGERRIIEGRYITPNSSEIHVEVKDYDRSRPLVIDPTILYSTYLGGSGGQYGQAIAVGSDGSAYVTGLVRSLDFPTVNPIPGGDQRNRGVPGKTGSDAFVAKLAPGGNALIYATYLGGSQDASGGSVDDNGTGIAVDAQGFAYVNGQTKSVDFPTTIGARQTTLLGTFDGFFTKLNQAGNGLVYSTYLGMAADPHGIALDTQGNVYMTGRTSSWSIPVTADAYQKTTTPGTVTIFFMKLDSTGAIAYSTYLGAGYDQVYGIAVDTAGSAYITGETGSTSFPAVNPIPGSSCPGPFITKFTAPPGNTLAYSTCIGIGQTTDNTFTTNGIAVDAQGSAYIAGYTESATFPMVNAYQPTKNTAVNSGSAYVTKLNTAGNALVYSTYLGGTTADAAYAIAVDSSGNAYVTGETASPDFPIVNPLPGSSKGFYNTAFVTKFDPAGNTVAYSTFLGGTNGAQLGKGVAVDANGNAYVTGYTGAKNFPIVNPLKPSATGEGDQAFVIKISSATLPVSTTVLKANGYNGAYITAGQPVTLAATVTAGTGTPTGSVTFYDGNSTLGTVALATGAASLTTSMLTIGVHSILASYGGDATYVPSTSASVSVTVTAAPPTVSITAPLNGAQFTAPAAIAITANASSSSGFISKLDFFDGSTLLSTYPVPASTASLTYTLPLSGVAAGSHSYTVRATDSSNAATISSAVNVTVYPAPTVSLTAPTNSAFFMAPALIALQATAGSPNGSIVRVEFFRGGTSLGAATVVPYSLIWSNAAAGTYSLTAQVTDSVGAVATSAPVTVTVAANPTVTVTNLTNGATVANDSVTVSGSVQATANSSVTVNGVLGSIATDGSFAVNNVPLTPGANTLTVTTTAPGGQSSTQTLSVTSSGQQPFVFRASPTQGLAPLTVTFNLTNRGHVIFDHVDVYCQSSGAVSFSVPSNLANTTALGACTYSSPGVYVAKVNVYAQPAIVQPQAPIYTGTQSIQVDAVTGLNAMLQAVYFGMLDQLKAGNINGALNNLTATVSAKYAPIFTAMMSDPTLAADLDQLKNIQDGRIGDGYAEFLVVRTINGTPTGFFIYLIQGEDGVWRIDGM
ncbi:MAG: DUF7948 domain-containing protein [Sulfuricaulis sp.]